MKAVLEPNEILIRVMPSKEAPSGYYYTVQTKEFFRVYDDLPEMFDKIGETLEEILVTPRKE